jgi:hypothetical protein
VNIDIKRYSQLKKGEKVCQTCAMEQMEKISSSKYQQELLSEMKRVENLSMTSKLMEKKSVSQNEEEDDFEMLTFVAQLVKPQHLLSLVTLRRREIYSLN